MGNEYPEHDGFEVGHVVTWTERSPRRTVRGRVERVTPNRVMARPDGSGLAKVFHRRTGAVAFECSRVDVAREQWQHDVNVWWETRPRTAGFSLYLTLAYEGVGVSFADSAYGTVRCDLAALDRMLAEAHAIREWLSKRPREPRSAILPSSPRRLRR